MAGPLIGGRFDLTGRIAVVTGASSGLGHRFAQVLAWAGATVVACARRVEPLEELARSNERITAAPLDVLDVEGRARVIREVIADHGRVDVLVNNAGISEPGRHEEIGVDSFARVLAVNLEAVFAMSSLVAPGMLDQGSGSIVNIGSVHSLGATWKGQNASYTAAKHGVLGLTRELACTWASRGVRVNALCPGYFETELSAGALTNDSYLAGITGNTPLGRIGREGELDGALLFLASDASTYCTGQALMVDGGWSAH